LPHVRISATHFLQIIINVIRNAAQACGRAGRGKRVLVDAVDHGATVKFSVIDEGPGIPADVLPRIGKAFYTTRAEGTGLGIAQVQRLLGIADGTFAIESEVGKGTTVTFTIPKK
ncbi:MAG TPA: HAMP domain-containing sensor histidine kinase, partial [Labilithrix sp.]